MTTQLYLFTWGSSIRCNPVWLSAVASTKEAAKRIILDRLEAYKQRSLLVAKGITVGKFENTLSLEGCYVDPAWQVLTDGRNYDDEEEDFVTTLAKQEPRVHPITEGFVIFSSCLDG